MPLQVALPLPFDGAGQGVQDVPHEEVLAFDTHWPLQRW